MRIALITHQWPGVRLGGIGVYTENCARAIAEAGHEAHVFTLKLPEGAPRRHITGLTVHEVADLAERVQDGSLPGPLAAAIQAGGEATYRLALGAVLCGALRAAHGRTSFDVVEGPEYEALALPLILSPLAGVPVITQLHSGSAIVRRGNGSAASADQLLLEAMEFAAILGADALCAPSSQVVADTRVDCPLDEAAVLPLPFYPVMDARHCEPPAGGSVLFIGRLETVKGAHLLPVALNLFLAKCADATVRIIGPDTASAPDGGSMAQWIRARLDAAIAQRITFVGEQSRMQLVQELAKASFVIVPSLFDSYSYVCCESLACGRAVIVSRGIGATEVVGDAGLAVERGNAADLAAAMGQLWTDRALLGQLSTIAAQRATKVLGIAATRQQRMDFYAQVISRGTSTAELPARLSRLPAHYTPPLLQAIVRLTMFLAGEPDAAIKTPGMRLAAIMRNVAADAGKAAQILLYGAGRHTSRLLAEKHLWESAGHRVIGLVDDHPRFSKTGTGAARATHLGLPVESAAALQARLPLPDGATALVLSTDTFQEQFWEQTAPLRARGVRVFKLYDDLGAQ